MDKTSITDITITKGRLYNTLHGSSLVNRNTLCMSCYLLYSVFYGNGLRNCSICDYYDYCMESDMTYIEQIRYFTGNVDSFGNLCTFCMLLKGGCYKGYKFDYCIADNHDNYVNWKGKPYYV